MKLLMNNRRKHRIIIGGGGTGGHVFPAISIGKALKRMDPDVVLLFVGARDRLEMEMVPAAGFEIVGLPVAGFQRRITLKNVSFFFKLMTSMTKSARIIRKFKPDLAVGVGGYASGPILKAAARKGVPIVIQEQNSYAGVTNRLLAKSAEKICVAYEGMEKYFPSDRIILTGNPVREELTGVARNREDDLSKFGLDPGRKTILVIGGSLGARTINESIMKGLPDLDRKDIQIIWQTGQSGFDAASAALTESGLKNIKILPFIREMDHAFGAADIIVSRAGAGTISELCLVGKPVILVPSPNVAEDHQTSNAKALVAGKAAVMVPDNLAREHLVRRILELIDNPESMQELAGNIKKLAIPDSAERIAEEVLKIIE